MPILHHILLAEDDADTRELMRLLLRHAGFLVSVTGDSSEVLELLATDHFDAVLLDNWMPGITGLELCRQIRSFDQNTPILFCSGAATEADKNDCVVGRRTRLSDKALQSRRSGFQLTRSIENLEE